MSLASDTGKSAEVHAGDFYESSRLALINVDAAKVTGGLIDGVAVYPQRSSRPSH